jgi:hypothetical protein
MITEMAKMKHESGRSQGNGKENLRARLASPHQDVNRPNSTAPDLEDDLQGLPNEEIIKSEILDTVCEKFRKEWLQSDACELGFQQKTDTDIANAAAKKGEEDEDEEEGQSSECIIHSMALPSADTTRVRGSERVRRVTLQPPGIFVLP